MPPKRKEKVPVQPDELQATKDPGMEMGLNQPCLERSQYGLKRQ